MYNSYKERLRDETNEVLAALSAQLDAVEQETLRQQRDIAGTKLDADLMKDIDGKFRTLQIRVAQALCMNTLAMLEVSNGQTK